MLNDLSFSDYITQCRTLIETRRPDLQQKQPHHERILSANSPFEYYPSDTSLQSGALLIHGLLDSPFSLRDIGTQLQAKGILSRSVLLPGHGTTPNDLLQVRYNDWIETVRYGISTFKNEVDRLYLVGYSTGAALSIYHALQDLPIAGLILLAPAIKIKTPIDQMIEWTWFTKQFTKHHQWVCREEEIDYAKYLSIAYNAVKQVSKLTNLVNELRKQRPLPCKVMMVVSREDETVCSNSAIDFFTSTSHPASQLLLYTSQDHIYPDARILTRLTRHADLGIQHLSHVSIPFSPTNPHYGQQGDYLYASHTAAKETIYGAYNRVEEQLFDKLYQFRLLKQKRRQLTYNPDFDFMAEKIIEFMSTR